MKLVELGGQEFLAGTIRLQVVLEAWSEMSGMSPADDCVSAVRYGVGGVRFGRERHSLSDDRRIMRTGTVR